MKRDGSEALYLEGFVARLGGAERRVEGTLRLNGAEKRFLLDHASGLRSRL